MLSPWDFSWILLRIDSDLLSIDNEAIFPCLDLMRESEMCRVIFDEVFQALDIKERIIDSFNAETLRTFEAGSEYKSANSS